MKRLVPLLAAIVLSPLPLRAAADPEAVAVAERTMEAMGGKAAFDGTRYLVFHWAVEVNGETRSPYLHAWDKWTGDYVLEGQNREGQTYRVVFNVNDRTGEAYLDGVLQEGEKKAELLDYGHGRFINDTYWLLMPWKWLDPGVNLAHEGTETIGGVEYDKVKLSFGDDVGLTSNDVYFGYVSRETGLMERWAFVLQDEEGNPGAGDPSVFTWGEWTDAGNGLRFSLRKERVGGEGSLAIRVWDLVASDDPPADWPFEEE